MSRPTRSIAAACLVALGLSSCSSPDFDATYGVRVVEVSVADREAPVSFTGKLTNGEMLDIADLRGEPVVLNVWWSGCGPCRAEMPLLNELSQEGGAQLVGINSRDVSLDNVRSFEEELGVEYPSVYPGDELLLEFGSFTPRAIPTTIVLDSEGRVGALLSGEIPSALTLERILESVDS